MARPPYERKQVSQEELNREFNENGWEERLKRCNRTEYYNQLTPLKAGQPPGTRTILYRYDEGDVYVALVCCYLTPEGKLGASGKPSPKELLIGQVYHYV